MTADDVPDVDALGMRTLFGDLPGDVDQEARRVWQYGRLGHLVESDPGGAWSRTGMPTAATHGRTSRRAVTA